MLVTLGILVCVLKVGTVVQLIALIENVLMVQRGLINHTQQIPHIKRLNAPMLVYAIETQEYVNVLMVILEMPAKEQFVLMNVHRMELV